MHIRGRKEAQTPGTLVQMRMEKKKKTELLRAATDTFQHWLHSINPSGWP